MAEVQRESEGRKSVTLDLICGIDPGISGGIAILDQQGQIVGLYPMPATERDCADLIAEFAPRLIAVGLESVHPFPRSMAGNVPMFKLGCSYGFLKGLITAYQIRREDIRAQVWQKAMGCLSGGDKNVTKAKAQQTWPKQKFTHKLADACLIAEHLRRTLK